LPFRERYIYREAQPPFVWGRRRKGGAFPLIVRAQPEEWTCGKLLSVSPLLTRRLVHLRSDKKFQNLADPPSIARRGTPQLTFIRKIVIVTIQIRFPCSLSSHRVGLSQYTWHLELADPLLSLLSRASSF
jgi:hypothetical protein